MDLPAIDVRETRFVKPTVYTTGGGTPYLKAPGFALAVVPSFQPDVIRPFLEGFDTDWDIEDYLADRFDGEGPVPDGADLAMFAGQLCYLSFGAKRTRRDHAMGYFDKTVREGGHGSIIEHVNYSVLLWGIDRAVTHELVRHRAGMAYSQVSQRYVSGKLLRFVEDAEYQDDERLHGTFESSIDQARREYDLRAELLRQKFERTGKLAGMPATEARKACNQAARRGLPNETEAPIFVTGNARAWRHIIHMRASMHADVAIRRAIYQVGCALIDLEPQIFGDFQRDPANWTLTSEYA